MILRQKTKMVKVFTLKCPKCGNKMKFLPLHLDDFSKKKKKCVYCGHTFAIHKNLDKSTIISVEKQ